MRFYSPFPEHLFRKQVLADTNPLVEELKAKYEESLTSRKLSDTLDGFFDAQEEVRIIVELESKPGIVIASSRNISYEQLSAGEKSQISTNLLAEQQTVKNMIQSKSISMEYKNSFTVAMNGFSGIVKFNEIEIIERIPNVKKVYLANEYEKPETKIDMVTSGDMVTASEVWQLDYEGEEQVVAILDTGIDYTHKDMVLPAGTDVALTSSEVNAMGLKGKYFTSKVPYGYNYYDLNNEVIDKGPDPSMHGMHVAGTAGANGDVENGGIRGIAPMSQLLAMKVFSNDPIYATTFSDIYLVAIDESIKLGADVINMSLGSTASFYVADSAENVALQNAVDNGIVAAVSAGNSGMINYGNPTAFGPYAWASNPDVGVVGAPGLNAPTIQVASVENTNQQARYLSYKVGEMEKKAAMTLAGPTNPATLAANLEYAYGGFGSPEELTEVSGKVALISRGSYAFTDKITNAKNAGAIAVIVFNNQGDDLINMQYPAGLTIPAVFIGQSAGVELRDLETKVLTFESGTIQVANPAAGQMSDFSSWGTTPTLELKPEITAPGGQIYSTMNNDSYGVMSGTSMAAPHVAGGSALVMEYVDAQFPELSPKEKSEMVKKLLMNTAAPILDSYDYDISPRSQGAGLMNLFGAVSTPVTLESALTGEAKVELYDFASKKFSMKLTATNHSNEELTYEVDTTVLKDYTLPLEGVQVTGLGSDYMNAVVDAPEVVVVPANGTASFTVTVDFSEDPIPENRFVEGFVRLVDPADTKPTVTVPYVGFYGDWGEPPIIDGLATSSAFGPSYFSFSGFGLIYEDSIYFNESEEIFINPGTEIGAEEGTDHTFPILSFMRNAEEVNYRITDAEGKVLRTIYTSQFERKDFTDGGRYNPYSIILDGLWDGTVKGNVVEEGQYYYEISAKIQGDREFQTYKMPVTVDLTAPEVEFLSYDEATRTLTFKAMDEASGLYAFIIGEDVIYAEDGKDTYTYTLPEEAPDVATIEVVAADAILNMASYEVDVPFDEEPYIYILEPALLEMYTESTIHVEGYVTNVNFLEKVLINETVEATLEFVENAKVLHPDDASVLYEGPAFKYTADVELEDGYQEMTIQAISENGAEGSLARRFYVDTTAPVLEAEVLDRESNSSEATIRLTMSDNLGYLTLFEADSQIFKYEADLVISGQTEKVFDYDVTLVDGENTFEFLLVDGAGHETMKSVTILMADIPRIEGETRFETAVEVSKAQFESAQDVVLAAGMNFPDALAGAVLASNLNGPLLLTHQDSLNLATKAELERLGAANVHILGGPVAVSEDVEAEIEALGYNVIRYAGEDRFETATLIGEVVSTESTNTVVLTNGFEYGELLAANAYASYHNYPALFTSANVLNGFTKDALVDWGITDVMVIGDVSTISEAVVNELEDLGMTVERIAGSNRELTSLEIAKRFFPGTTRAVVSYGYDYPDGLVGGSYAASLNAPVLLVDSDSIEADVLEYIGNNIEEIVILGGPVAVNDDVLVAIYNALME